MVYNLPFRRQAKASNGYLQIMGVYRVVPDESRNLAAYSFEDLFVKNDSKSSNANGDSDFNYGSDSSIFSRSSNSLGKKIVIPALKHQFRLCVKI